MKRGLSLLTILICLISLGSEFKSVQDKILTSKENIIEYNDVLFVVARSKSSNEAMAITIATHKQSSYLVDYYLKLMPQIENLSKEVQHKLLLQYVNYCNTSYIRNPNIKIVYQNYQNKNQEITINWYIPLKYLKENIPNWQEVFSTQLKPEMWSQNQIDPLYLMEIAPSEMLDDLVSEYARRCNANYGGAFQNMVLGRAPRRFSLKIATTLTENVIRSNRSRQLFQLLNDTPNHPAICYELAQRHQKTGLNVAAQMIASWGTKIPFLAPKESERCGAMVTKASNFSTQAFELKFDISLFEKIIKRATFAGSALTIYNRWGSVIVAGSPSKPTDIFFKTAQQSNSLEEQYRNYCQSIALNLSYDACYEAGIVASKLNYHNEAILLLIQAAAIKPSASAPWESLAKIVTRMPRNNLEQYCLEQIQKLDGGHDEKQ